MAAAPPLPTWLLTREQIANSPSREDGLDVEQELLFRRVACDHIIDIRAKLEKQREREREKASIPVQAVQTAIVFLHRFYSRRSLKRHDKTEIAVACLFLACKVCECLQRIERLIPEYLERTGHARPFEERSELFVNAKDKLVAAERLILNTLEYDVEVEMPYRHIDELAGVLMAAMPPEQVGADGVPLPRPPLHDFSIKAANDVLRTTLCLQYDALTLAMGCVFYSGVTLEAACKMNPALPRFTKPANWSTVLTIPNETAHDIIRQIREAHQLPNKVKARATAGAAAAAASSGGAGGAGAGAGAVAATTPLVAATPAPSSTADLSAAET